MLCPWDSPFSARQPQNNLSVHLFTALLFLQASKEDSEQPSIAAVLQPFDALATTADVCVVGCGPAGLALAAELGSHGLSVALIGGHDAQHACLRGPLPPLHGA